MSAIAQRPPTKKSATRPSTSKTVPQSALQQAVKGLPAGGPGSTGTVDWLTTMMENARSDGSTFGATDAMYVEPLPPDSDHISASRLVGVTLFLVDVEFKYANFGRGDVMTAQFTIYIESRPELGKRYVTISSRRGLAQAKKLQADGSFPLFATIEKDAPAFEGAIPGNILAEPREESAVYLHAPLGEDLQQETVAY